MDATEEIKSRLNIEDVISEYVQLKRAGRNWRGLSPFGNEHTPSFMVSPEKQIWHDFSSGKGGNMFSFVMEMEGLDFKGALELLARKAGVDLEQFRGPNSGTHAKEKERLYEALELTTKFYQAHFAKSQTALRYVFQKRVFSKETALEWRLGYSPSNGSALITFLRSKGFTEHEMRSAGVTARNYRGGIQDMFRGRIMIPLCDPQGRVIGFTARILEDDPKAPKYINTPQTILYDKSRHVFGLHLAKEAIRRNQYAVLVEGNLDVIASHGVGVRQVVATAGTALTQYHLKALSRFTGDIRLSFDQDKAGLQATERAIPIASQVGISLSIITIPTGKDPDELIKQDIASWQKIIEHPQYALDWLIERYSHELDITSGIGKRQFSDIILPVVAKLVDEVERDHYLGRLADLLGVSKEALQQKLKQQEQRSSESTKRKKTPAQQPVTDKAVADYVKTQDHLLALHLLHPDLRGSLEPITVDMVVGQPAKTLLGVLKANPEEQGNLLESAELSSASDYVKMLVVIDEELYQNLEAVELEYESTRLQTRLIEQYTKVQKQRIAVALRTADETQTQSLLVKARQLDTLLKQHKGGA
jgi:DNA primase